MELINRIYQTPYTKPDVSHLSVDVLRECFELSKAVQAEVVNETEYLIMNAYQLQNFIRLQKVTGIYHKLYDISEEVLMGTFPIENDLVKLILHNYEVMEKTVDHVLDKISLHNGVEKLNDYDRKLLKKQ